MLNKYITMFQDIPRSFSMFQIQHSLSLGSSTTEGTLNSKKHHHVLHVKASVLQLLFQGRGKKA